MDGSKVRNGALPRAGRLIAGSAIVVALLGGCHSGSRGASSVPTTASTSPGSSSESTSTSTTASGPDRCHSSQLQISLGESGGAAGHIGIAVTMKNTSKQTCRMFGFVGVRLFGPQGNDLGVQVQRGNGFVGGNPAPHEVLLAPAQTTQFELEYGDVPQGDQQCPTATKVEIIPPDERDAVVASLPDANGNPLSPCDGQVTVTPVGSLGQEQP